MGCQTNTQAIAHVQAPGELQTIAQIDSLPRVHSTCQDNSAACDGVGFFILFFMIDRSLIKLDLPTLHVRLQA